MAIRSSFPSVQYNFPHLRSLGLEKVIALTYWPEEKFAEADSSFGYSIMTLDELPKHLEVNSGNMSDFTLNSSVHMERQIANTKVMKEILEHIKESEDKGEKILIACANGKYLTSITIGCWRKTHQSWAMSSVFEEMRRFAGVGSSQLHLEQFVEMY